MEVGNDLLDEGLQLKRPVGKFVVPKGAAEVFRVQTEENAGLFIGEREVASDIHHHLGHRGNV